MAKENSQKKQWFKSGVCFTCLPGCRRCCGGAPGDVWVTDQEIKAIAEYLTMSQEAFEQTYVRRNSNGKASLKEKSNFDCVLLDEQGCSIYPVRPKQCRDYPWWPEVMKSKSTWKQEMKHCPGIGEGPIHDASKIAEILESQNEDL